VNQTEGAALAARHLLSRGCRHMATIAGPQHTSAGQDRLTGYRDALPHAEPIWVEGDFTRESGTAGMAALLSRHPTLDGVFAASDLMAQGALAVLRAAGRAVPDDVAVVGFDDSSAALACEPPLTTVRQPVEDMAAEMARLLLRQIDNPETPVKKVIFEPELIHRQSA